MLVDVHMHLISYPESPREVESTIVIDMVMRKRFRSVEAHALSRGGGFWFGMLREEIVIARWILNDADSFGHRFKSLEFHFTQPSEYLEIVDVLLQHLKYLVSSAVIACLLLPIGGIQVKRIVSA